MATMCSGPNGVGIKDLAILELAETEARVLLTLDKDFWQIARQRGKLLERAGVLLFRIHLAVPKNLAPCFDRPSEQSGNEAGIWASWRRRVCD